MKIEQLHFETERGSGRARARRGKSGRSRGIPSDKRRASDELVRSLEEALVVHIEGWQRVETVQERTEPMHEPFMRFLRLRMGGGDPEELANARKQFESATRTLGGAETVREE